MGSSPCWAKCFGPRGYPDLSMGSAMTPIASAYNWHALPERDGTEQPTPVEGVEIAEQPEKPTDDGEACLHHVTSLIGGLPLGKEGTVDALAAQQC